MVNRKSRDQTCRILKRLALGRISSYECENEFVDLYSNSDDPVIFALYRTVFEMGGELDKPLAHLFVRGGEMRRRVCRWIFFLKTDLEYEWPQEQLAPGVRDFYKPNWFDKLFGLHSQIIRSNEEFCSHGDYRIWPFFRESDFSAAKAACAQRRGVLLSS